VGSLRVSKGTSFFFKTLISAYAMGNRENPDPKRPAQLLLHKSQLEKLRVRTQEKGLVSSRSSFISATGHRQAGARRRKSKNMKTSAPM